MANAQKNPLLDGVDQIETVETPASTVTMRPTIDLPAALRILKPSFWPATDTKQAQYGGWSPELNAYARCYGDLADGLYEAYGAALVAGESTGDKVSLVVHTYPNANGLFFGAQSEEQRDFISLNEYSVESVDRWAPKVVFHNAKTA
jgi:hypothetical protein